jgi:D-alanyl-D-alanine carboxypeptidase
MARLISYAAQDELISTIMRTEQYTFRTSRRTLTVHSTNQLLKLNDLDVLGGKTGFIARAGYCLATLLHLPDVDQTVAVVVLGAKSNAGRFWETRHLLNWVSSKAQSLFSRPPGRHFQPSHQLKPDDSAEQVHVER